MEKFAKGAKVRKKGSQQTMEVVGEGGISSNSATGIPVTRKSMIVCRWTTPKGKTIAREFVASDLQAVIE